MSTYYKYAERNVENQIDWSKVGGDFTTMLKTESELREKKKADIEKATQQTLKTLADAPTGLDRGVNENILNYSSDSQNYMLMMNRLLKSGQLDPKDYSIYTQNLKTDTEKMFQTTKLYQEKYAEGIERAKTGTSAEQEVYLRSLVENAANFSKSKFYINNNGRVTVGLPQKDPATGQYVLNDDPNTYNSIDALRYAATVQIDKYDVDKEVANVVSSFGKEIQASAKLEGRVIRTIEDIKAREGYEVMEQRYIDSLLVNPNSSASILTDWIKTKGTTVYGFTNNPNDPEIKRGGKILMIADPANPTSGILTPQLSPEQKKEAENFLRDRIRMGLDYEAKTQYYEPPQPQEWQARRGDEKTEAKNVANMLGSLYYGDESEVASALDYFKGLNEKIVDIRRDPKKGIIIKYSDGTGDTVQFNQPNGDRKTQAEFIKSATALSGNADVLTALKKGGFANRPFSSASGVSSRTVPSTGNPLAEFNKYINRNITKDVTTNEDQTVSNLNQKYGKYGYSTRGTGVINEVIEITAPDGKTKKEFKLSSPNVNKQIADWMKGTADIKKIGTASVMGATQGEGTEGELD